MFLSATIMTSALAALVSAGPARVIRSFDALPYPLTDLKYNGTLGGHEVALSGTVQSIFAQTEPLFPDFNSKDYLTPLSTRSTAAVETRNKNGIICGPVPEQNWGYAIKAEIQNGINYLNGLSGGCGVGASSCVPISCSEGAAIYLCNDNTTDIAPTCSRFFWKICLVCP